MTLAQPRHPPAMLDANARGTLQAEELLGKSECKLLPCFDRTHSMEGIELLPAAGSEFECLRLAHPQPTHPMAGELPIAGRIPIAGQIPIAGEIKGKESPSHSSVSSSIIHQVGGSPTHTSVSTPRTEVLVEAGGHPELDQPTWPDNLVGIIESMMSMEIRKPTKPKFAFDMSMEAAERNYLLLKKYDGSLATAIRAQGDSPLSMGSEFRPPDVLQAIYGGHPIWERMVSLLKNGSTWPLDPIDEDLRQADLHEALEFGNHKGAKQNPKLLLELVLKDVKHGYAVTFPLSKAVLHNLLVGMNSERKQVILDKVAKLSLPILSEFDARCLFLSIHLAMQNTYPWSTMDVQSWTFLPLWRCPS